MSEIQSADISELEERKVLSSEGMSGTNITRAGDYNQRVTLQVIRTHGPITRADIAIMTGLTAPTIANITNRLLKDQLIQRVGRTQGMRGQPASIFVVKPDGAYSIGLNIDRDHIALLTMDFSGAICDSASMEARFAMPDTVLRFVDTQLERMRREGRINMSRIIGIGIGIPDDLGSVQLPHKPSAYEKWSSLDVAAVFEEKLGIPVYLENDATAAALGELQFGQAKTSQNFIYTLISAGLGCGIIINGAVYRGSTRRSGEIGFLPARNHKAGDGARTVQDIVSLYSLYDFLAAQGIRISEPDELTNPDDILQLRLDTWTAAAADALLDPFLAANSLLNPEAFFIGGRLPAPIIDALCAELNRRMAEAMSDVPDLAPVLRAATAEDAASMGAAALVFQQRLLPQLSALMKV